MLSRRSMLAGVGAACLPLPVRALQDPSEYGLQSLLSGSGFVEIKSGEFSMGSKVGPDDERPIHQVRITRAFEIGKFEVTQSQWETVMRNPHAKADPKPSAGADAAAKTDSEDVISATPSHFKGVDLPVESVSWNDVQVFLERLNSRADNYSFRLPTEAEWEYACRAGAHSEEPPTLARAWFKENAVGTTKPIAQRAPNRWGIYDALGNVSEWVQDWYRPDYYTNSPHADPPGPTAGSYRVYRGGSWLSESNQCLPSTRGFDFPRSRFYNVGFRLVRETK